MPGWEERARILGVEPRLDRVAAGRDRRRSASDSPSGDPELELDEVEPRYRLGDGVLDLDPAVQLQEEDVVAVDEELRGTRALVAESRAERDGVLGDALGGARREPRRR